MKEPIEPRKPSRGKLDYGDKTILDRFSYPDGKEEVVLYADSEYLFDDGVFEFRCEECEDKGCEECESWNHVNSDHISLCSMTLQDIIDKIPEGYSPSDVKMTLGSSLCSMGPSPDDHVFIRFVYRRPIDLQAEIKKYEKAQKRYEQKMVEYQKAKKEYDEWKHAQDIAEAQAKLDELKRKEV